MTRRWLPISNWKNPWTRRAAVIALVPLAFVYCVVVGAAYGVFEYLADLPAVMKAAWKGHKS